MFGQKGNKTPADTSSEIPKLNPAPYEGTIENAVKTERAKRKQKINQIDLDDLWEHYRSHLDKNVINGFSRNFYGGFWNRLWALLIDLALVQALQAVVFAGINFSLNQSLAQTEPVWAYLTDQVVLILYFTFSSYLLNGQTIGKALLGLQVVSNEFYRLPLSVAFVREGLGKLILLQFPFLALFAVISPKRQNFMDYFTDTNVISLQQFKLLYEENCI